MNLTDFLNLFHEASYDKFWLYCVPSPNLDVSPQICKSFRRPHMIRHLSALPQFIGGLKMGGGLRTQVSVLCQKA